MREAIIVYKNGKQETVKCIGTAEVPEIVFTADIQRITLIGVRGDYLLHIRPERNGITKK